MLALTTDICCFSSPPFPSPSPTIFLTLLLIHLPTYYSRPTPSLSPSLSLSVIHTQKDLWEAHCSSVWGAREALRQSRSTQLLARSPPSASGESGDWYDARLFGAVHAASASVQSPVLRERPALVQVSGSGGWCVCVCDHSLFLCRYPPSVCGQRVQETITKSGTADQVDVHRGSAVDTFAVEPMGRDLPGHHA